MSSACKLNPMETYVICFDLKVCRQSEKVPYFGLEQKSCRELDLLMCKDLCDARLPQVDEATDKLVEIFNTDSVTS